eukprot:s895_g20.t2
MDWSGNSSIYLITGARNRNTGKQHRLGIKKTEGENHPKQVGILYGGDGKRKRPQFQGGETAHSLFAELAGRFLANLDRIGHGPEILVRNFDGEQIPEQFLFQKWRAIPTHPPAPLGTGGLVLRWWLPVCPRLFAAKGTAMEGETHRDPSQDAVPGREATPLMRSREGDGSEASTIHSPLVGSSAAGTPSGSMVKTASIIVLCALAAFGVGTYLGPMTKAIAGDRDGGDEGLEFLVGGFSLPSWMPFVPHGATNTTTSSTRTSSTRTTSTATRTVSTTTSSTFTKTTFTSTSMTKTSKTTTSQTITTTPLYPTAPFSCLSGMNLGPVKLPDKKGIALDDTTFSKCPSQTAVQWPNAQENISSLRLFKAWDANWEADRLQAWKALKEYIVSSGVKVLYGTQISCNETADDTDWLFVKELMIYIGRPYVMGVAVGNEVELLHTQKSCSKKCAEDMWDGGYFLSKVMHRANDLNAMPGFADVRLTTVMGGFVLGGQPFVNTKEARVHDFFKKINANFGRRWAWSWNTYPYFDPHIVMDEGPWRTCSKAMMAAINFAPSSMLPGQLRALRTRMQQVTGNGDDTMWLTETGWSYPRASTLSTVMRNCAEWSTREAFSLYYQGFLEWDLGLGPNVRGLDHAFFFTLRDSVNFGDKPCLIVAGRRISASFAPVDHAAARCSMREALLPDSSAKIRGHYFGAAELVFSTCTGQ